MTRVAVIDIGSNSIKCLVATRNTHQQLIPVSEKTLPVRISTGINASNPRLSAEAIIHGVQAVSELLQFAAQHAPLAAIKIVATSAVRDATNQEDFKNALNTIKAPPLTILSGDEEAFWIAQGILEDPSIPPTVDNPTIVDLGGGSLELVSLHQRNIVAKASLQLGAVRMTEAIRPFPQDPLSVPEIRTLQTQTRAALAQSGIQPAQTLLATGGIVTVWRAMIAASNNQTLISTSPLLNKSHLQSWITALKTMTWEERVSIQGLPPSRADIFPTGIVILDTVMEWAKTDTLMHSFYNLRYGLAAALIDQLKVHPKSTND